MTRYATLLALLVAGCSSHTPLDRDELARDDNAHYAALMLQPIPMPETTPYDDNPELRTVYREWYWAGYWSALRGIGSTQCGSDHPWSEAQSAGHSAGQRAGHQEYAKAMVASAGFPGDPAYTTGRWPLGKLESKPAEVKIESATRFQLNGVPCQLLGLRESGDPATRAKAKAMTEAWFRNVNHAVQPTNESNPLLSSDGRCVVWLRGGSDTLSCLNLKLAEARLVEVTLPPWRLYAFTEPASKTGPAIVRWQDLLENARGTATTKPASTTK